MNQPGAIYDSSPRAAPASSRDRQVRPIRARLRAGWHALLDLVFPPQCAGCQRVDTLWCADCQAQLAALPLPPRQHSAPAPFAALANSGAHEGLLRRALLALKFENSPQLAEPLGARLAQLVSRECWATDLLAPVPLHPSRERERGYNQAQLIGQALAQRLGIAQEPAALRRVIATRAQVGLDAQQRQHNVAGAFDAVSDLICGRRVLLVDDVFTTGSTLGECAAALRRGGAQSVHGLTLTRAGSLADHREGVQRWT